MINLTNDEAEDLIRLLERSGMYIGKGLADGAFDNCAITPSDLPDDLLSAREKLIEKRVEA